MKNSLEQKGFLLALISSLAALAWAFITAEIFASAKADSSFARNGHLDSSQDTLVHQGHTLFLKNCAHCHGEDARGDEGPDLHQVKKTDDRIAKIVLDGIKGEMPKFRAKFTDADVLALVAFIRSLDSSMGISASESTKTPSSRER